MKKEKKEKKERKGILKEFKEFISRGNVIDLAVGIIIGGAFTAIVTALCDHVLKPIINVILALIIGSDSLDGIYTYLKKVEVADEAGNMVPDLVNSIYIDWGSLINAIINFILIAIVLFLIIKIINSVRAMGKNAKESVEEAAKKRKESKNNNAESEENAVEEAQAQAVEAQNDNPEPENSVASEAVEAPETDASEQESE